MRWESLNPEDNEKAVAILNKFIAENDLSPNMVGKLSGVAQKTMYNVAQGKQAISQMFVVVLDVGCANPTYSKRQLAFKLSFGG